MGSWVVREGRKMGAEHACRQRERREAAAVRLVSSRPWSIGTCSSEVRKPGEAGPCAIRRQEPRLLLRLKLAPRHYRVHHPAARRVPEALGHVEIHQQDLL